MIAPVGSALLSEAAAAELAREVISRCRELARVTDVPGGTTRTFLSEGMRRANEYVTGWMEESGMQTRIDGSGNLRGILPGKSSASANFIVASHLDTVPNAGAFDGPLGVLAGIALAHAIGAGSLPFSLEVIAFSEEEGVRFGVPFIGSRGLVGSLDDALLATRDSAGVSVREAMEQYGLPERPITARTAGAIGYLELHIEQGPELDSEALPLGAVETIAGQSRLLLTFTGTANHAGTTPMRLRRDALAAAAAFIVATEQYAMATPGLVATVGSIHAQPNAVNVIAGTVVVSLDVRSASDSKRTEAVEHLLVTATSCAQYRKVQMHAEQRLTQAAVPMDRALLRTLEDSLDANGATIRRMVSGAGHDAMIVAPHIPAGMLFLRSPNGISHHPDETVRLEDVALALRVGYTFLHSMAAEAVPRKSR